MAGDEPHPLPEAPTGGGPPPEPAQDEHIGADASIEVVDAPFAPPSARATAALTAPTVVPVWPTDTGLVGEPPPALAPTVVPIVPQPPPLAPAPAPAPAPGPAPAPAPAPAAAPAPAPVEPLLADPAPAEPLLAEPEPVEPPPAPAVAPPEAGHGVRATQAAEAPPAPVVTAPAEAITEELREELRSRLAELEGQVGETMDRVAGLVESQLPDAVAGLRDEFEAMRTELQDVLQEATDALTEERRQLRTQIATTIGAANRWFVRARDQLYDRLDEIAELAAQAEAQAQLAAAVRLAPPPAALATPAPAALEAPAEPESTAFEWDVEEEAEEGAEEAAALAAPEEWDEPEAEEEPAPPAPPSPFVLPATVELALESEELDALMGPVRLDMQELQMEVAAMGQAIGGLTDQLERLRQRMPSRSRTVRLDPAQVEEIVDTVAARLAAARPTEPSQAASAPKKASAAKKAAARTKRK